MLRPAARPRTAAVAAAALGAVLLLGACAGPAKPGAAAVVGDERITDAQVADTTNAVKEVLGGVLPNDLTDADLNRRVITNRLQFALVAVAAEREGLSVTQGEIDRLRAQATEQSGSEQALLKAVATQYAIPPSEVEAFIRFEIAATALIKKLGKGDETAGNAAAVAYLGDLSEELGTEVSPRFGTWVPASIAVGPPPSDLATEPGAATPTPTLVPDGGASPSPSAS